MIGNMKAKLINGLKVLRNKGFFDIIVSSSLVRIVSFISAIFLPRLLSKTDYGVLTYVDNIRNYIILINGLGIANATLRFCTNEENEEKKKGIFRATVMVGVVIDLILCTFSILLFAVAKFEFKGARELLIAMAFLPLTVFLNENIQYYLRAVFANKEYSRLAFAYSGFMVLFQILMTWMLGVNGVVVGRYIATFLSLALGLLLLKRLGVLFGSYIKPTWLEIKGYIKFGIIMMTTNMASLMMQLNETFILGLILKDELALADYKVASFILTISIFISQAMTLFLLPYFVQHTEDKKWIWSTFKKATLINAVIMIPLHLLLIALAEYIVLFLYGAEYVNAVALMRVLLVASLGQTVLRMLPGNILGGIGKEKFNLHINFLFLFLHAAIDVLAIKIMGVYGAAVGLIVVYYVSGLLMIWKLRRVCREES